MKSTSPLSRCIALFFTLFIFQNLALSQDEKSVIPIITIDKATRQPDKVIPFDQPFILKMRAEARPLFISYVTPPGHKTWQFELIDDLREIPQENFWLKKK